MARYKQITIRDFAGLNEDENPDSLGDNELSFASNVWPHGRAIGTRPGLERDSTDYTSAIASGKIIHGLTEFRSGFDANRDFVAICGGVVHTATGTTVANGAGVVISDPGAGIANAGLYPWTFATHKNLLYAAGGANGDTPWSWDGAAANNTEVVFQNAAAADIDAKFIFEKHNFLFLCGMNGSAVEDNPTIFRYSAINDGATWPIGNTVGGTSAIGGLGSYGDEFSTGFGEYTDNRGDWLLFLTNRQIYPVEFIGLAGSPFRVTSGVANGCVSQSAFVPLGIDSGDAVYLSRQGIHSLRQSQSFGGANESFLSWKIRPTFARINQARIRQSVGTYWPEEGIVLFAVPTDSSTYNNTILCLDLKGQSQDPELRADTARWYVWQLVGSQPFNANVMTVARDSVTGKRYLYIGDCLGNVLRFNRDVFSDVGSAYAVRFQTKHNDFGVPGVSKGLGDVWVGLQPGGSYEPKIRFIFDYGRKVSVQRSLSFSAGANPRWNEVRWDQFKWGVIYNTHRDKVYGTGQGDTIAFELTHSGLAEPFRVTTLAAQVRSTGETVGTTG